MSAVLTLALPSFGTCSVTSVETLEVQYTLFSKLVFLLPCWMNESSLLLWWSMFCFVLFFNLLIYLFSAALGLRCCTWAFCSCGEWGLLLDAVCRL